MQLRKTRFRCDLCGKFRDLGVTETFNQVDAPDVPDAAAEENKAADQTSVCATCIADAVMVMANELGMS